jgi:nucleoside-diphosphate-sugar epimerase
VTGGSGFLGRALVAALGARGHEVRVLRRRPGASGELAADLSREDPPAAALAGVRTVFHLAALTHAEARAGSESDYEALNVEGTRRVLDAALAAGARRFVFVSSVKAMGEGGPQRIEEDAEPRPTTAYGRSKLAAERLVLAAADRLHATVLRLPMVYGPEQKDGNLARLLAAMARGLFPPPPRTANRRSMVHRDTVVEALLLAAADPRAAGRTYVVTDGAPYGTRELYDWAREAIGRRPSALATPAALLRVAARAGDLAGRLLGRAVPFDSEAFEKLFGSAWYADDRIRRELGFRAERNLRVAMPALLARQQGHGARGAA